MKRKGNFPLGLLASILATHVVFADSETAQGNTAASSGSEVLPIGNPTAEAGKNSNENSTSAVGIQNENAPETDFSAGQLKAIKAVIDQTLKDNPEIIVEALQKLQERQQIEQQKKMQESLTKNRSQIVDPTSGILLGKENAGTKLVVFIDPNCPHCRTFEMALHKVRGNHPDVAILLKYWPILGDDSKEVARGLLALKDLGKNEELSKLIAAANGPFTYDMLRTWVANQKLNPAKFDKDAQSSAISEHLDKIDNLAKELGLQGTPTSLLVNKDEIRFVLPTDEKSLDSILKSGGKAS